MPLTEKDRAKCIAIARFRGDAGEVAALLGDEKTPPAETSRYEGWEDAAGPELPKPKAEEKAP